MHLRRRCILLHWMECPEDINEIHLTDTYVSFKSFVVVLIFCFDDLSIGVSRVLKSPTIIVFLSISPFMSVNVCLMYCSASMLGA